MSSEAATAQRERELKFDVPEDWQLPDTATLERRGYTIVGDSALLSSTYYDTEEHDLLGRGLTLRRRVGDVDEGWQLKVPSGDARTELRLPPDGTAVPRELQALTLGVRRGARLRPIAELRTHRAISLVRDADGTALAELVVDEVTAIRTGEAATVTRWREVEVELKEGDEAVLRRMAKWLRASGATPSRFGSKLARALDRAPSPDGGTAPATDTLHDLVRAYLDAQHDAILRGDVDLRRDLDVIHATRVGTRRYRSILRVFAPLFDTARAVALDAELAWYASVLGGRRDLEVLADHLHADLDELPPELVLGPVRQRLDRTLDVDMARARRKVETALRSRRYLALLDELHAWSLELPSVTEDRPASSVAAVVRAADKKVSKRLARAHRIEDDPAARNLALHSARKAAKRARYTAELAEPALGKSAKRDVKRMKKLQDELGGRQDAVVATAFLRRVGAAAGTTPGENGFTFGILLASEARRGNVTPADLR